MSEPAANRLITTLCGTSAAGVEASADAACAWVLEQGPSVARAAVIEISRDHLLPLGGEVDALGEQHEGSLFATLRPGVQLYTPPPVVLEAWSGGQPIVLLGLGQRNEYDRCALVVAPVPGSDVGVLVAWLERHELSLRRSLGRQLEDERMRRHHGRLSVLQSWMLRLAAVPNVDSLVAGAGEALATVFPGVYVALVLGDPTRDSANQYELAGGHRRTLASVDVSTSGTLLREVLRTGSSVFTTSLAQTVYPDLRELASRGYRAAHHIPMLVAGRAIGVLVAASRGEHALEGAHRMMFEHVAALLAAQLHARRSTAPGAEIGALIIDAQGSVMAVEGGADELAGVDPDGVQYRPLRRFFDASSVERLLRVAPGDGEPVAVIWGERTPAAGRVAWAVLSEAPGGLRRVTLQSEGQHVPVGHATMRATRRSYELLECAQLLRTAHDLLDGVRLSIRRIATGHGASRAVLWSYKDGVAEERCSWSAPGAQDAPVPDASWASKRLNGGTAWWYYGGAWAENNRGETMPSAAVGEVAFWESRTARAAVCAPCGELGGTAWWVSLEFIGLPRQPSPELATELHWFARSVGMERDRRDREVREAAKYAWWKQVFAQLGDPVTIVGTDDHVRCANDATMRLLNRSENELRANWPHGAFAQSGEWDDLKAAAIETGSVTRRCSLDQAGAGEFPAEVRVSRFDEGITPTLQVVFKDLRTELQRADIQRSIQERQILDALTAGVVHDFNNLLTPILTGAEILALTAATPRAKGTAEEILRAATRAKDLTAQLLDASRGVQDAAGETVLAPVVHESVEVARSSIQKRVQWRVAVPDRICVSIDAGRLHQVLVNLLANSARAVDDNGAVVSVTAVVEHEETTSFMVVHVSDNGHGMPDDVRARAFEPYFTTQERGRGTGLGLATSRAIVRAVGGDITLDSHVGVGTRVSVRIPIRDTCRAQLLEQEAAGEEFGGTDSAPALQGLRADDIEPKPSTRRVLCVDDQRIVADTLAHMLEILHYEPSVAYDPREALREVQTNPGAYDVVFVDGMMPHMDGIEFVRRARAASPNTQFVAMTGLLTAERQEAFEREGVVASIEKPFGLQEIQRVLGELQALATEADPVAATAPTARSVPKAMPGPMQPASTPLPLAAIPIAHDASDR